MISLKSRIAAVTISVLTFTHCAPQNESVETRQKSASTASGNQAASGTTRSESKPGASADAIKDHDTDKITQVDKEQIFALVGDLDAAGTDADKAGEAATKLESLLHIAQDGTLSLSARIAQIQKEITKLFADPATKKNLADQANSMIAKIDTDKLQEILRKASIKYGDANDLTTQILNTAQAASKQFLEDMVKQKSGSHSGANSDKIKQEIDELRKEIDDTMKKIDSPDSKARIEALKLKIQELIKQLLSAT